MPSDALSTARSSTGTLFVFGPTLTKKVAAEELLAVTKEESFLLVPINESLRAC